ncbi:MAG: methylenetetrahydrofolate--tRNA-(uracil(54)-C(5))-methyltransferase (FADH(2)-oxidizing) TrmFO [Clostridia bacterium]|nr:methylenetetrahydrofolate--tRNA-(uracil(54)-C(5))-methyltransferase (FADH(2)-oxidizing) TrmFO [Clostridia bacterium]
MSGGVTVVGAGLAGCEAAWQLARRGVKSTVLEMKPEHMSPAHGSTDLAELVCSNSLRGAALSTAPGLLKEEMRRLGSLIIACADECAVPAGGALAVDRTAFSAAVTERVRSHPLIEVRCQRVESIPEGSVIIATGPLTDGALAREIGKMLGEPMHFFDAAAPIVSFDSINMERAYFASRYDKGTADYINCPMDKEEYLAFWRELREAEEAPVHGFEDSMVFEGCMPVEVMARRGEDTLRYGPMKPVGLRDPRTGKRPYAVVQLRADDRSGSMFNIVGFQTHLRQPEQRRVFRMIPGLEQAEFLRYGVMHRSSFVNAPGKLDGSWRIIGRENIMLAGQLTGVEGYIESAASGLCAGIAMAAQVQGRPLPRFPRTTALGALAEHVSVPCGEFKPMNINFGIIEPLGERIRDKRARYTAISERALAVIEEMKRSGL